MIVDKIWVIGNNQLECIRKLELKNYVFLKRNQAYFYETHFTSLFLSNNCKQVGIRPQIALEKWNNCTRSPTNLPPFLNVFYESSICSYEETSVLTILHHILNYIHVLTIFIRNELLSFSHYGMPPVAAAKKWISSEGWWQHNLVHAVFLINGNDVMRNDTPEKSLRLGNISSKNFSCRRHRFPLKLCHE